MYPFKSTGKFPGCQSGQSAVDRHEGIAATLSGEYLVQVAEEAG